MGIAFAIDLRDHLTSFSPLVPMICDISLSLFHWIFSLWYLALRVQLWTVDLWRICLSCKCWVWESVEHQNLELQGHGLSANPEPRRLGELWCPPARTCTNTVSWGKAYFRWRQFASMDFNLICLFVYLTSPHVWLSESLFPDQIKPMPPAVEERSCNHWASRELPVFLFKTF